MPSANWIRAILGLAAASMLALTTLTGDSIDKQGLRWLSGIASAITLGLLVFDRWAWRWPGIRFLTELGGSRVIHGTWRGALHYEKDADGNPGEQPIYMAVAQTYSSVKICCLFPTTKSESMSLASSITQDSHRHVLRYIYRQQAQITELDRNRPTEGTCELRLVGRPVKEISGSYYVERNGGKGTIEFDAYSKTKAGSIKEAQELKYTSL